MGECTECKVENTFYLEENSSDWKNESNEIYGLAEKKTRDELIKEEFVERLNQNNEKKAWGQDIDGSKNNYYPILLNINY